MVQYRDNLGSIRRCLLVCVLVGAAVSCAPEKPSTAKLEDGKAGEKIAAKTESSANIEASAVARVNGEAVSLGEFNRRVRELPEFARVRYASVSQQQEWLDSIAQFEVMADVAEKRGLGERPEVYFALKKAMANQLLEDVVREKLSMSDIDEDAIDAYYKAHQSDYQQPQARRVVLIEVATREEAARIRERVAIEMQRAEDSEINAFRRAAAAYSTDRQVGIKGGDIGFVLARSEGKEDADAPVDSERQKRARIAAAITPLERPGEVTPVFALDPGWALATFIEERPASKRSREEAAGEIRQTLYEQRRQTIVADFIASLRKDAKIERFSDVVDSIKPAAEPSAREISEITLRKQPAFGVHKPKESPGVGAQE